MKKQNPLLLLNSSKPLNTVPFDEIKTKHFMPAFEEAMRWHLQEIEEIEACSEPATFQNTIERLEQSGAQLDSICSVFFNLNHACSSDEMLKVAKEISPRLTEHGNIISFNEKLFKRVETVWKQQKTLALSTEQKKLLENTYLSFVRSGVKLSKQEKRKYRSLSSRLSIFSTTFQENLLHATHSFEMLLTLPDEVAGIPEKILHGAEQAAHEKNKKGWLFTLQMPDFSAFMKYAERRDLRKKIYDAYTTRATTGEYDNRKMVRTIASLRRQKSQLLGYPNYAAYVLERRMAKSPEKVYHFLDELKAAYLPKAWQEKEELEEFAKTRGLRGSLKPWDWSFYSEKLRIERYNISDEQLRPYFQLEKVIDAVFNLAQKLYGLHFVPNSTVPVYHADVTTYEVRQFPENSLSALLYLDFFPRKGKQQGAWMTEFKPQKKDQRPHVSLVMNFTKPTPQSPSLLTFNEVQTFLHEFGHALHSILSQCTYASLSGTHVVRDFVELPSQLMENWAQEKEWLDKWAIHHETQDKIPSKLLQGIRQSRYFQAASGCVRQLAFGYLDMAWHVLTEDLHVPLLTYEKQAIQEMKILPTPAKSCISTSFGHIFGGGYAAGYYGYKWAEVLEADAFAFFKKYGIYSREAAQRFRQNILERGGTESAETLYRRFRGKKPTIQALLKRDFPKQPGKG